MAERDVKYEYGADLNADPVPLIDPGIGKTITLRTFDFIIPPRTDLKYFPKDKQQIFNDHARLIKTMLWADGLIPYEGDKEVNPKIVVNLKARKFKIIVAAQARSSTMFIDNPKPLHEMLPSTAPKSGTKRH